MVRGPRNRSWRGSAFVESTSALERELSRNGGFLASPANESEPGRGLEPMDDASRSTKVASLKARIAAGLYHVPSELVADRLMEVMMAH